MSGKLLRSIIKNGEKERNEKIQTIKKRGITKRNITLLNKFVNGEINLVTADSKTKAFFFNNLNEIVKLQNEKKENKNQKKEENKLLAEKQHIEFMKNSNFGLKDKQMTGIDSIPSLDLIPVSYTRNNKLFNYYNVNKTFDSAFSFLNLSKKISYFMDSTNKKDLALFNNRGNLNTGMNYNLPLEQLNIFNKFSISFNGEFTLKNIEKIDSYTIYIFANNDNKYLPMLSFENLDLSNYINRKFDLTYSPLYVVIHNNSVPLDIPGMQGAVNYSNKFIRVFDRKRVVVLKRYSINDDYITCIFSDGINFDDYIEPLLQLDACPLVYDISALI